MRLQLESLKVSEVRLARCLDLDPSNEYINHKKVIAYYMVKIIHFRVGENEG